MQLMTQSYSSQKLCCYTPVGVGLQYCNSNSPIRLLAFISNCYFLTLKGRTEAWDSILPIFVIAEENRLGSPYYLCYQKALPAMQF